MYKIQNLEIVENFFLLQILKGVVTSIQKRKKNLPRQKLKRQGML